MTIIKTLTDFKNLISKFCMTIIKTLTDFKNLIYPSFV